MRVIADATPKMRALLGDLDGRTGDRGALAWAGAIRHAQRAPQASGGMRGWCRQHDWASVDLMLASFEEDDTLRDVKVARNRTMRSNPLGVMFYGEDALPIDHRYNRVLSLAQTEQTFVGYSHDYLRLVVYRLVDQKV